MSESRSLGQRLDDIIRDMNAASAEWAAAGYPMSGEEFEAREAVFAKLRNWNRDAEARR